MAKVTLKVQDLKPGQCMAEVCKSELDHHWAQRIAREVAKDVPDAAMVTVNLEVTCWNLIPTPDAATPQETNDEPA